MLLLKKNPENENPNKIVDIVKKFLHFNKQQKGEWRPSDLACVAKVFHRTRLKMLTLKKRFKDYQQLLHK